MTTLKNIIHHKYSGLILYGIVMAALLLLLRTMELKLLVYSHAMDFYIGFIAVFFTLLGVWLAMKLTKPKINEILIEKEVHVPYEIDEDRIEQLGISKRELEILQMMSKGYSNQEISDALFISLSTVKTHVSNIFTKLDAKRRTQAIEIAKGLKII